MKKSGAWKSNKTHGNRQFAATGSKPASAGHRRWNIPARLGLTGGVVFLLVLAFEIAFDFGELFHGFIHKFETIEADGMLTGAVFAAVAMLFHGLYLLAAYKSKLDAESDTMQSALTDGLTGLATQYAFERQLRSAGPGDHLAVICIDPKRFSEINDAFGRVSGDELLVQIAERLQHSFSESSCIARLTADVFTILVVSPDSLDELFYQVDLLESLLSLPFGEHDEISLDFAVGVARLEHSPTSAQELMRRADLALHEAKKNADGGVCYFHDEIDKRLHRKQMIERRLRVALAIGAIEPYFQPIMCLKTGRLTGFEVLARWHDTELGQVSPTEFIRVAEACGLVGRLGESIIIAACKEAAKWPEHIVLSVNLSPLQLTSSAFAVRLLATISSMGLATGRIQLEVTESSAFQDSVTSHSVIALLRDAGVKLVIDDFGTGYSSFDHLIRYGVDGLKLDRTLVAPVLVDHNCAAVVETILVMAGHLGISVTVEGLESVEQHEYFKRTSCQHAQGYFYGKPVDAVGALAFVRNGTPSASAMRYATAEVWTAGG